MIDDGSPPHGGSDPERNSDQEGDDDRGDSQLEGGRKTLQNLGGDRRPRPQRRAEIGARKSTKKGDVLHGQWPIEPELLT